MWFRNTHQTTGSMLGWLTDSEADTRDEDGPDGRRLHIPYLQVWEALGDEVTSRSRWTLVHADRQEGRVRVECTSLVFGFVDDLEVEVGLDGDGLTRVEARSASRDGKWDFGVNRRRIRRLMRALDRRLSS